MRTIPLHASALVLGAAGDTAGQGVQGVRWVVGPAGATIGGAASGDDVVPGC